MYRKILVGYDRSDRSKDALALGEQLARATGAELVVAGVFGFDPLWGGKDGAASDEDVDFARAIEAAAATVGGKPDAFPSSSPARGLHELAEEIRADLILVGSARHGRVGQVVAGSTGIALLHGSPCAVGVAPRGYAGAARSGIATVAVGFDGSDESRHALTSTIELAGATGAKLKLVSVAVPPAVGAGKGGAAGWHDLFEIVIQRRREQLDEALRAVPGGIEVEATLVTGPAPESLADVASEPGTLLVVGSRGYGPLRRALLGSVATHLVRWAPCPLIVTPRGARDTADAEPVAALGAVAEQLFPGQSAFVAEVGAGSASWPGIVKAAQEQEASVIVTSGSTGFVHHSQIPVLVVPEAPRARVTGGPVLLCWDDSEPSKRAIAAAGRLFGPRRAVVLHLWESWAAEAPALAGASAGIQAVAVELDEVADEEAERSCRRGVGAAEQAGFVAEGFSVRSAGPAWRTVLDAADQQSCSAIVVGSRGLSGFAAALGSLSDAVLHHAHKPVLVVPPEEENR
jgi:nucleotide-binding universal stress UspA family protein